MIVVAIGQVVADALAIELEAVMGLVATLLFIAAFYYAQKNHWKTVHHSPFWMVFSAGALTSVFWTATVALEWLGIMPVMMDEAHTVFEVAAIVQFVIAAFLMTDARVDTIVA